METFWVLTVIFAFATAQDCVWDRDVDFSEYPPLIMDLATWKSVYPVMEGTTRTIRIAEGADVVLACPEDIIMATGTDVADGTCVAGGDTLNVDGTEYTMMELGCENRLHEAIDYGFASCTGGTEHAIGYDVTGYPFYNTVLLCFDHVLETALSTVHFVRGPSASASDPDTYTPSFKVDSGFFTVSADNCYSQDSQIALFDEILGDSSWIDVDNQLYFARGHISPNADFFTEMEGDATYYYCNVLPQWQSINNGNWKALEADARDLAEAHDEIFEVYGGPMNILTLPDTNNNQVEIYLGLTEDKEVIPAPEFVWKVVYEPATNEGVAVIMSNNPYLTSPPTMICSDICSSITWLDFDMTDYYAGYTYCCTVDELAAAVPNAPDIPNVGLLTE